MLNLNRTHSSISFEARQIPDSAFWESCFSPHSWKNQWGHRWIRPTHGDLERWWSWITDPETPRSTCFHVHNPCTGSFFLMCLNKYWFIYQDFWVFIGVFLYFISLVGCSHLQKVPWCFYHLKSLEINTNGSINSVCSLIINKCYYYVIKNTNLSVIIIYITLALINVDNNNSNVHLLTNYIWIIIWLILNFEHVVIIIININVNDNVIF